MLASKYSEVIEKESAIVKRFARILSDLDKWILMATAALMVLLTLVGFMIGKPVYNQDADDFMAPVDTVYYDRFLKYKEIFPENSTSNYQGHWLMQGLGMYVSVVIYKEGGDGPLLVPGTMNAAHAIAEFGKLVENNITVGGDRYFVDLCAQHSAMLHDDHCYRMGADELADSASYTGEGLYKKMMVAHRNPDKSYILDFPTTKSSASGNLVAVPGAEIFGTTSQFNVSLISRKVGPSGPGKFDAYFMKMGEKSALVDSIRYAWHLRYDTEESKLEAKEWMDLVMENCKTYEDLINKQIQPEDTEGKYRFMCYKSTSISDGAQLAIKGDVKWILLVLFLSLVVPVLVLIKPCAQNNFSMLALIAVGVFFFTIITSIAVGALFGFDVVYTLIVSLPFVLWSFMRLTMSIIESLKGYLIKFSKSGTEMGYVFDMLVSHWLFAIISNSLIISVTSFLVCCSMYKMVWATAGIIGLFYLFLIISMVGIYLPAISMVLKSRDADGKPCCMGRTDEDENSASTLNSALVLKVNDVYKKLVLHAPYAMKCFLSVGFCLLFLTNIVLGYFVFSADQWDSSYYGYNRHDIVLPEDNVHYVLDTLEKYYPNNGPIVQLIFNNKTVYYNNIDKEGVDNLCSTSTDFCLDHYNGLMGKVFNAFWTHAESAWNIWTISFFNSYMTNAFGQAERDLYTEQDVLDTFTLSVFKANPWFATYPDMARFHVPEDQALPGDPYTRMFIRQKYLFHTADEVKFMTQMEEAQEILGKSDDAFVTNFVPADSFELYSNLFLYYEQSRDILSRTFVLPAAIIGCVILTLITACVTIPHFMAHLVVFLNATMLVFDFFVIQVFLGSTMNNFSMAYYFLIFLFAVDYSYYSVNNNVRYLLLRDQTCAPSAMPAVTINLIALVSFGLLMVLPVYSQVGVSFRCCAAAFGLIGTLHELLFVPGLCGMLMSSSDPCESDDEKEVKYKVANGAENGVELQNKGDKEVEA